MGGYYNCKWCNGQGCISCEVERKKDEEKQPEYHPIFSAKLDNPKDMKAVKKVFGKDALNHAFGPDGEGIAEIERNAAIESLHQKIRESLNQPIQRNANKDGVR